MPKSAQKPNPPRALEAWILAGGLSSRMGRDKSRLRLGGRTMTGHVRAAAAELGIKVRTLRRDDVARCGPLGGIYTALKRSRAERVMVLACDMPLVSAELLRALAKKLRAGDSAVFACADSRAGFPCILRRERCTSLVLHQIECREFSLQSLARALKAKLLRLPRAKAAELTNINTPADFAQAREALRRPRG